MKTKEQLEADIKLWDGVNKYIVKEAKNELKELNAKPKEEKKEVVVKEEPKAKPVSKKDLEGKLFAMNKEDQVKLLKELGAKSIPKLEADRVKLIIKLQV